MNPRESRSCFLCDGTGVATLVCAPGSDVPAAGLDFSARLEPTRPATAFYRCGSCRLVYSSPGLSAEESAALYARAELGYEDLEDDILRAYEPLLREAARRSAGRDRFVEIGGGSGFVMEYAARAGFRDRIEVEPSREGGDPERARWIRSALESDTLAPEAADLACFFHVLDHAPDPLEFLRIVHRALKPGGAISCVVHNARAVSARLMGARSPIFDIQHTYLFDSRTLRATLERAGFTDIRIAPIVNRYPIGYWLKMAPIPFKERVRRAAARLRLDRARLPLFAGNLGVVATKGAARA